MGLGVHEILLLAKVLKNENPSGRCLTFGVQGVDGQYDDIAHMLKAEGYPYTDLSPDAREIDDNTQFGASLHQTSFFKMLGFTDVDSLDFYSIESPTYVVDLNKPITEDLLGLYDLVYDGGTTEHIFDTRQVLTNAVRLIKPNGLIVHDLPMSGLVNHGFYQFSPCLFYDFYGCNGFEIIKCYIYVRDRILGMVRYAEYDPSMVLPESFGNKTAGLCLCVRKTSEEDTIRIPNQGDSSMATLEPDSAPPSCQTDLVDKVRPLARKLPPLFARIGWWAYCKLRSRRLRMKRLCRSEPLFRKRPI